MSASERRIRNNRIRRKRELRKNIGMCLVTAALVCSCSILFFGFGTRAQGRDEEVFYKYYRSIVVENGDSLWDYAGEYGDSHYNSKQQYIQEVMQINGLSDDAITRGQHLVIPYYSSQFVQ